MTKECRNGFLQPFANKFVSNRVRPSAINFSPPAGERSAAGRITLLIVIAGARFPLRLSQIYDVGALRNFSARISDSGDGSLSCEISFGSCSSAFSLLAAPFFFSGRSWPGLNSKIGTLPLSNEERFERAFALEINFSRRSRFCR